MRSIEDIEKDIEDCKRELDKARLALDDFEPDDMEAEDAYDEMLDDCYEPFRIGSMEYSPSLVLREVDPIAYRCGLNDFTSEEPKDRWSDYPGLVAEKEELEGELSDLEDELEEAKEAHEEV